MSFLQPGLLFALPLMLLPILIHLINRQRHRSVRWAAMMFLVRAKRMQRGMARLRYVLIMLLRMLAIGVLVFAASRPLASGKLGGMGLTRPDATIILLDRSLSMETQDLQTGESRRSTALRKLASLLESRGFGNQLVLIDSASGAPRTIESPADLADLPFTEATATSANVPAMLETALAVLDAGEAGRADVWICSDLSANDWDPSSGRWASLREAFAARQGVQHYLLSYSAASQGNVAVRVENVRRRSSSTEKGKRAELVLDVRLLADRPSSETSGVTSGEPSSLARTVPVEFEIDGVSSVFAMELGADGAALAGHRISIDTEQRSGWGVVRVPGDSNALDNEFYFTFAEPVIRRSIIITDDARSGAAFRRVLAIPSESGVQHEALVIGSGRVGEIDWERTGLLIWHAPLPAGVVAEQVQSFVNSGRVALFFPAEDALAGELYGISWGEWHKPREDERELISWRNDTDLFARVDNGQALPLDELRTYRYRSIEGAHSSTPLARLSDGTPLFVSVPTDRGAAYFCGTLPTAGFSSLERDAVAFYVMMQRALERGSRALSPVAQLDAASGVLGDAEAWETVAPADGSATVLQRGLVAGVYRNGDDLAAVNRSLAEDVAGSTSPETVDALFEGLSFQRIEDEVGDTSSLASEIWRMFLILMALALIVEALLCLPAKTAVGPQPDDYDFSKGEIARGLSS